MAQLESLDTYVEYLTQQHFEDQEVIAAQLALALYPIWRILQFEDLDSSTVFWLQAAIPLVRTAWLQSQRVTAVYTQNVRFASLPADEPLHIAAPEVERPALLRPAAFDMPDGVRPENVVADEFPQAEVAETLTINANYKTKQQMPGPQEGLMQRALSRSSGAAVRRAMNGGTNVADNVAKLDRRKILGWARVTDSDPCYFCALLASRGMVFVKGSFKSSNAKYTPNPNGTRGLPPGFTNIARVHDNCRCALRPVYSKSQAMDHVAKFYRDAWNDIYEADENAGNKEHLRRFRAWVKDNPFPIAQFELYELRQDLNDREQALTDAGFSPDSAQVSWAQQQRQALSA